MTNLASLTTAPDAPNMVRESRPNVAVSDDYDRAVANYNNCVLEHTADLRACDDQRATMNAEGKVLSRSSSSQYKIINEAR